MSRLTDIEPELPADAPKESAPSTEPTDILTKQVEGKSQNEIVRARFLQHKGAVAAMIVLALVVLTAFTSVGFWGWHGWWMWDPQETSEIIDGGAPTMSVFGPDGLRWGIHPFGQDEVGRDLFARVMLGSQTSLIVMVIVGLVAGVIGVLMGALAGYFGGRLDRFLMAVTDLFITIPIIVLGAVLGALAAGMGGPWLLAVFLGIASWTTLARLVRGEFMALRHREFVDAAHVMGVPDLWIILRHVLPNCMGVIIVNQTLLMSSAILLETSLSFVGFGIRFPDVSLGQLINEYQQAFTTRPWLFWWPGILIVVIALCINFIGDGLRDAFDPRQKRIPSKRAMDNAETVTRPAVEGEAVAHPVVINEDVEPLLEVKDLTVEFFVEGDWHVATSDISYTVRPGEILAIVGESGSGKSQSSIALLGLLPQNGRATGSAVLNGDELIGMPTSQLRQLRGDKIAMVFQEPMTALNPVLTIGFQIVETIRVHTEMGPSEARARALELLEMVEMPEAEKRLDYYPHQFSGGQRQRAMIAKALACDPGLLVADEPTTALDVTVQAEVLSLLRGLRDRTGAGIVIITHDMGVVSDLADNMIVMKNGNVVERGSVLDVVHRPMHPYTQGLLASVPHLGAQAGVDSGAQDEVPATDARVASGEPAVTSKPRTEPSGVSIDVSKLRPAVTADGGLQTPPSTSPLVVSARDLVIEYPGVGGKPGFRAVKGVDLDIGYGEVVGLVGESGSGKSTIGRAAVGLLATTDGTLDVCGVSMKGASREDLKPLHIKVGMIFQDPGSSLNPRLPLGQSIGEPLALHRGMKGAELNRAVDRLLDQVELPHSVRNRYPHELSGGQRQRVGIARALALEPELLVADEPTSALDVSVQAKVLQLFQDLQSEYGFACIFVSHDLAVVEQVCDRIAVLNHGEMVEVGATQQVIWDPRDPYTRRLIAAVPVPDPEEQAQRRAAREELLAVGS